MSKEQVEKTGEEAKHGSEVDRRGFLAGVLALPLALLGWRAGAPKSCPVGQPLPSTIRSLTPLLRIQDLSNEVTTFTYDSRGRVVSFQDHRRFTRVTYYRI
jgi:hypothetical protein